MYVYYNVHHIHLFKHIYCIRGRERDRAKKNPTEVKTIHFQIGIACVSSQSYNTYLASLVYFFFLLCISVAFKVANDTCRKKRIKHIWHMYVDGHSAHIYSLSFALKRICIEILELLHVCHVSFSQHTIKQLNTSSSKCLKCVNEIVSFANFIL